MAIFSYHIVAGGGGGGGNYIPTNLSTNQFSWNWMMSVVQYISTPIPYIHFYKSLDFEAKKPIDAGNILYVWQIIGQTKEGRTSWGGV